MNEANKLVERVESIGNEENNELLARIFSFYLRLFVEKNITGSCHDSSVLLYIMLSEYGFNPTINIGVVRNIENIIFDHSWVTIDDKVYDIAIYLPHINGQDVSPPIFSSKDIVSNELTNLDFGVDIELDIETKMIMDWTIGEYLQSCNLMDITYNLLTECNDSLPNNYKKNLSWLNIKNTYFSQKRHLKKNIV